MGKNKVLIQIGTNDGKDDFRELVGTLSPAKVILVEPNSALNADICTSYDNIENVFLENVAITEKAKGMVTLCHPAPKDATGISVNGIFYHHSCFSLLPMDDWGDNFNTIEAESMTFNELCEKYGVDDIHYLQIDTEGYDAEIIKSIDFSKVNIDIIKYEDWSFDETNFKRHGDKSNLYGINGMNYVANLLRGLGYELTKEPRDIIATKVKKDVKQ